MEMKWTPIIDGDLSGIPQDEEFLFSIFDERGKETYVATGWIIDDGEGLELRGVDPWGLNSNETIKVKAWMELPSPFHPNDCNMCAHYRVWIDGFGDRWSKCELWNEPFAMVDCPLR